MVEASASRGTSSWPAVADEESRAYLQARLVVISKLMFVSFVGLLIYMLIVYGIYPAVEPTLNRYVYVLSGAGLMLLAFIWRGLLLRRQLTLPQLKFVDVFYQVGTGTIFGASGALAYSLRSSAYICLIYACLLVVLRATIIPSTGKRTVMIGALTVLPMIVATVVNVYIAEEEVPGPMYVSGAVLICTMSIALAAICSNILYGLRRQVTQLGQYTLDGKIGEGGNGAVYRARHALLRRQTALKMVLPDRIDGETLDRFEREVQHMSQLTHANTVAVYDYGRSSDGVFYYVMEYLDGIDLEKLVARFGAQPADRVVPILIQVCGALAEAHRRGIVHRDIKPANIILSERGDVPDVAKVVDFGLVKELAQTDGHSTRGIMGTPSYISPESVTDPDKVGPASDLYALGAVGYYLVTGKRVFEGKTSVDVCVQHVTAKPVPPSQLANVHIPGALEEILLRCLAKTPAARPASASELARQLRAIPLGTEWTEEKAIEWWAAFKKLPADRAAAHDSATRSVTIDIGIRTPVVSRS
ncbi:MAG TPA: serine/threonine-protein kinase [Kofleriaceae bacterium]|nr:serine/threonine-protein kinase [Kofleriaceae bacterium]